MALSRAQLEKYADVLVWGLETARTKPFKPYDTVLVRYDLAALPLAEILHRRLVEARRNVVVRLLATPGIEKDFYSLSDARQRKFIAAGEEEFYGALCGNVYLAAPDSLTHLKDVDPKRIAETAVARKKLREIMVKREERGLFGWTLCSLPTPELATKAGLSVDQYAAVVAKACFLNDKDPVATWRRVHAESNEIKTWLNALPVKTVRVETKSMDLTVTLGEKRRFLGVSGHNIPSFEIFTSPDWRGTSGVYYADQPSYRSGNLVQGARLVFAKGRVTAATAKKGEDFLRKMLAMDRGAAQLGEFSLTDKRFSRIDAFMADTLYDENYGGAHGNCHVAVGDSYSDTYAGNPATLTKAVKKALGFNDSALHWDLVNTEDKMVTATLKNGKTQVIYEKGQFRH